LERLAYADCKLGRPEVAAQRLGSADALRETIGVPIEPRDKVFCETITQHLHRQLDQEQFTACWTAGRARPLEEVIDEALVEDVWASDGRTD
jgi:hypothetical protein